MQGTKFQLKVWKYLKTIPKGKIKTYKQVAIGIKSPKSARAVANACAKNPYAPKIPCHRVIRSDGTLGGYSGVATKSSIRSNYSMTRYFWSIRVFSTSISYSSSRFRTFYANSHLFIGFYLTFWYCFKVFPDF